MQKTFMFENGHEAEDVVTGFKGIIMQRVDYLTGCNQYYLLAKSKNGAEPIGRWVDEPRVKLVKNGRRVDLKTEGTETKKPGGMAEAYPARTD